MEGINRASEFSLNREAIFALSIRPGSLESTKAVQELAAAQLSKNLVLLRVLSESQHPAFKDFDDSVVEVLKYSQEADPDAFASAISHPQVSRWLSNWSEEVDKNLSVPLTSGSARAIACAVGVRCRIEFSLKVNVYEGRLRIPGIGQVLVDEPILRTQNETTVEVRAKDGVFSVLRDGSVLTDVSDLGVSGRHWQGLRQLRYSKARTVTIDLDDITEVEKTSNIVPLGRTLDDDDLSRWQKLFVEGYGILDEHHPGWANEVALVFRSLCPLQTVKGNSQSVTSAKEFGSCVLTEPLDAISFAETLVHELQHNKFNGILYLTPMTTDGTRGSFYAPWRPDPRPLEGLLHGIYAFFGVADFWRVQTMCASSEQEVQIAQVKFARWRLALDKALESALASEHLTKNGRALFSSMHEVVRNWLSQQVPADAEKIALDTIREHEESWRERNKHVVGA